MGNREIRRITFNDMDAVYIIDEDGTVGFSMVPAGCDKAKFEKGEVDPLVQISCTGDIARSGFEAGETRHGSGLTMSMKYVSQEETVDEKCEKCADIDTIEKTVTTVLENENGIQVRHIVSGSDSCRSICVRTEVKNNSKEDIMIEALSSFALSGITPYADDEATGRLLMHRFRSRWSAEGRHEVRSIEDLMLEPAWARFAVRCEKFGTLGSMPIRGFFPVVAIEDTEAGVVWGATNACSSSWQIEAVRTDENLSLAGGLADYEYGHWRKSIKPGESFATPEAYLTVAKADVDTACDRMLDVQRERLTESQRFETLPAMFNEYCTTWGEPSEENIRSILTKVDGKDFDYFVIDAGWYADAVKGWQDNMGDWNVATDMFPNGLKPVVEMINKAGMKAGVWFELETIGKDADIVADEAHMLTRDGKIIISGTRRFWDMRMDWVENYLTEKVINFLNDNGFEYIKIDYNDSIGMGCDGADSPGEGLRQSVEGTKRFFRKIHECVPGIAIEICSSGGHRLEPAFMEIADQLSFSDAHEEKEIPVIALDLHRLVLPSKSQIWAVLRGTDELKRIVYSVCAGMYGVLCISGTVFDLSDEQWELARRGVNFYKKVSPVINKGFTKRFGPFQTSNRALKDYQASVRYGENGQALVIVHAFDLADKLAGVADSGYGNDGYIIEVPLDGDFEILDKYETGNHDITVADSKVFMRFNESFDGIAILLQRLGE